MKRRYPLTLWLGLLLVLASPVLYLSVFIRFPATRDHPLPSLVMFGVGLGLLIKTTRHAFRDAAIYRGKVAAPLALAFGIGLTAFFCYVLLYQARQIPASLGAPHVGQAAPDFTLPDQDGQRVSLAQLIAAPPGGDGGAAPAGAGAQAAGVLLVFYRGYW